MSGDYFDIFPGEDTVGVLLADISGHGVPAAMISMYAKQSFSNLFRMEGEGMNPTEILGYVNRDLVASIRTHEFITAFYLQVDRTNNLLYSNAGHHKAIYVSNAKEFTYLDTHGIPLGIDTGKNSIHETKSLQMRKGERVFLYTDGILEQRNKRGEEFGMDNFTCILREICMMPLEMLHQEFFSRFEAFRGAHPYEDDITFFSMAVG